MREVIYVRAVRFKHHAFRELHNTTINIIKSMLSTVHIDKQTASKYRCREDVTNRFLFVPIANTFSQLNVEHVMALKIFEYHYHRIKIF